MTIAPAFLDEIRSRIATSSVVGRKVKLTRAGREYKGNCPFHNEKTPSFYVNDEKAFYHCFGCGAHGDVVRFVCEAEGRTFREAVEQLAAEAGLDMPQETPEDRARVERLSGLVDIMSAAQAWFTEQLQGLKGTEARSYLQRRGLSAETIKRFGLGFAPDQRDGLKSMLLTKGASEELLIEAGLLISVDEKAPYDRFRGRIMFPIRDPRGRTIAFGGRILGDGQPKYLNSPDTPLFDKGRTLYNLDIAAAPARKSTKMLVVEGYMDVIALAQAGHDAVVAPLGTALTETHIQTLWKLAPEPLLCFDGDSAGQRAALRAALRASPLLEPGKSLRFVTLPEGQDPDDVARSEGGQAIERLLETAEPLVDLLWRWEVETANLATPEGRAALRQTLEARAAAIENPTVRRLYQEEFRARFNQLQGARLNSNPAAAGRRAGVHASPQVRLAHQRIILSPRLPPTLLDAILIALLNHPGWIELYHDELTQLDLGDSNLNRLLSYMIDAAIRDPGLDNSRLDNTLAKEGFESLIGKLRSRHKISFSFTRMNVDARIAERDFAYVLQSIARLCSLDAELASAQSDAHHNDDESLMRPSRIAQERASIERDLAELANSQSNLRT